jgi:hypothetical protein
MVEKEMQFNDGNAGGGGVSNPNNVSNEPSDKSLLYVATFIVALVLLACVLAFL